MDESWIRHYDKATECWYWVNPATGEMRPADDNEQQAERSGHEESASPNADWCKVFVIRSHGGGPVFKHWAIFVQDANGTEDGFICNVEGERERYRYEERRDNPFMAPNIVDVHQVGYLDSTRIQEFKDFARAQQIHNEDKFWGCQDFAWTLVEELQASGLLEHAEEFEGGKARLYALKGPGL